MTISTLRGLRLSYCDNLNTALINSFQYVDMDNRIMSATFRRCSKMAGIVFCKLDR